MTDRSMIKAQIIDNTKGGLTMARILNSTIPHAAKMDVSTGYFSVGGYGLLRESLENSGIGVRLMMGRETMIPADYSFEAYARMHGSEPDAAAALSTKSDLDESDLTAKTLDDTAGLLRLLRRDDVLVRMGNRRFNHSKCYVLGETAVFIGSSNLTRGGLTGNYELNSVRYDPDPIRDTQEWFDRMWGEAEDAKDKLVSVLEQSKFGVPPSPYDVYIKMLFERYKHILEADPEDEKSSSHLAPFQREAVNNCMAFMSEFGGALVADATGLGKTEIALEVMGRKAVRENRKHILLIAPAQVLRGMWDARLKEAHVNVQYRLSAEELGRDSILENLHDYAKVDMVVIDESQSFRSKSAKRRKNLMKLLAHTSGRKKHVLLLSATPVNNSLMDLYYQLRIITRGVDDYFYRTIGIPSLYNHMRDAADRDGLQQGLAKIEQLLAGIMVRRTRSYIKDVYPDDEINGRKIRFPQHSYAPIRYSLSGVFGDVFRTLAEGLSSLTMAPYGIDLYNRDLDESEQKKHRVLAHLQAILLLKRFESSKEAVQKSLENKIRLYEYVRRAVEDGKILRVKEFNRIAVKQSEAEGGDPDLDAEELVGDGFMRQIQSVNLEELGRNYDAGSMKRDIDADLVILKRLLSEVNGITMDTKLDEVTKTVLSDMNSKGIAKAIIFTEYTDTAKYVASHLREKLAPRTVRYITGDTEKKRRAQYIKRFAPKANPSGDELPDKKEIDVLVSTEVLSEGQNLQDCNYVVNYDLPWNPMRIVQRIGRVDRLTSDHDTVYSRACYPDDQLNELLKLMATLVGKIDLVNKLGLLETELLEEIPTPKQFEGNIAGRIRTLAAGPGSESVIEDLERESDLMPGTSPLNELYRYMKQQSIEYMRQIPIGRRSGKAGEGQKAVLMYVESPAKRPHFVVYDYKDNKARIPVEDEAMRLASCRVDEPRHLPMDGQDWQESFYQLLHIDGKAREAVLKKINDPVGDTVTRQGRRPDNHVKNVEDITEIMTEVVSCGQVSEEAAEKILQIIGSQDIRAWDDDIKNLVSEYRQEGKIEVLLDSIQNIGKRLGTEARPVESDTGRADPSLRLIGAMFVTGSKFDPDLANKGLKKHS